MSFHPDNVAPMPGRIAIVTGANTGLGFATARVFAQKRITTVMACRTEAKAQAAIARIQSEVPEADLVFIPLDLSELASVRAFAAAFRERFDKLDLLVNNAGIMMPPFAKTVDGFESQMAANYLGHFLLTSLLLDMMPDSPASRVVALSSNAHKMGQRRINFDDLQWEQGYASMDAYAQTKLACLMFGNELAERLKAHGSQIVAASAHPGISDTELSRHMPAALNVVMRYTLMPFFTHKPDKGALPQIEAALEDGVQGGDYFGPTGIREFKGPPGPAEQIPYARDPEHRARLWEASKALTGAVFPWEREDASEAAASSAA